eukprot:jgi/Botrbrau1/9116/Bobra.0305s0020.1
MLQKDHHESGEKAGRGRGSGQASTDEGGAETGEHCSLGPREVPAAGRSPRASSGVSSMPWHIAHTPAEDIPWLEMGSPSALVCHLSRSVERRLSSVSGLSPLRSPFMEHSRWRRSFQASGSFSGLGLGALESPRPSGDARTRSSPNLESMESLDHMGDLGGTGSPSLSTPLLRDSAPCPAPRLHKAWWQNGQVVRTVVGYGSVCFLYNLLDELVPIYSASPLDTGGLDLTAAQLSAPLSTAGVFLMAWALVGYPRMQAYLGPTGMIKFGLLFTAPMSLAIPASSLFASQELAAKVALTVALCLKNVGQNNSFSSSSILVNLMAPPQQVGAINGASQTLASFVRAVGPALGGYVWAFSLSWGIGHQFFPFAMASFVAVLGSLLYYGLEIPPRA